MWAVVSGQIAIMFYFYPQLPDRVVIHFDAMGRANGWAAKSTLLVLNIGIQFFVAGLFHLFIYYFPKMPEELVNIPNKAYWFSAQRRSLTIKKLERYLLRIANLTILLTSGLFYLTIEANYYHTYKLGNLFWLLLGLYLAGMIFLTIEIMWFFFKVPKKF